MSTHVADAQEVAAFVVRRLQLHYPRTWRQAPRATPLLNHEFPKEIQDFNHYQLHRVPNDACLGLLHWARGDYQGVLWKSVPSWLDILEAQSFGARPVTVTTDVPQELSAAAGIPQKYAANDLPLAFTLHDLRHLHKFFAPPLHEEQVAFFRAFHAVRQTSAWQEATRDAHPGFHEAMVRIGSDMNGAAAFLVSALHANFREHFPSDHTSRWSQTWLTFQRYLSPHSLPSLNALNSSRFPVLPRSQEA